jgi:hypothetical protein
MKNLIRHILKEETNKSLKLFTNLYDIEDNGSVYRGENRFQTYVTFYPKDYDNEMTREAGTSICNWEIDDDGELIFKFMSLPQPYLIPLMNYVGDTEDLEDYLEDIHVEEAEKFLKRINHRRDNPLKEDVDKNKKFLSNVIGEDVINSIQKITSAKQLPIEFLKSIGVSSIQQYIDVYGPLYYFVLDGEPFLYKDRVSPKGEEYEMYINNKGKAFLEGEITERLGLSIMGLRFLDVIDTIFNKEEPLTEDVDFTGKGKQKKHVIEQIMEQNDITYEIYYKKRNYHNGEQYDSVDIKFYIDRGNGRKPEALQSVYFKTIGNKIKPNTEPIVYGDFHWIFDVFEYLPSDVLTGYFTDKAKEYIEKILPLEYPR